MNQIDLFPLCQKSEFSKVVKCTSCALCGMFSFSGTSTALRMCYRGYGYPLALFLEEGGVVTVCKINTQEPEELLDFDFCSTKVVNKIILQSEGLREAFAELDMTSEVLQITMSPDKPYFRY